MSLQDRTGRLISGVFVIYFVVKLRKYIDKFEDL